jgi:hypothetical protein
MKTRVQNFNLPHTTHRMPRTGEVVTSDERGVIECSNSDADALLQTPGWARPGDAPRQPAKTSPEDLPKPPEAHEVGGGGIVGETNRRADALLAQEEARLEAERLEAEEAQRSAALAAEAAKTATAPAGLSKTASREETISYASKNGVKIPPKIRSAALEELRAFVVEAVAASASNV